MAYRNDIELEKKFAKMIKAILGCQFISQSTYLDQKEATDFAIFEVRSFKVGARLRRYRYLKRYGDEFTIRWSRPSGVPTEIHKIRQGLVDYILYGFIDGQECNMLQYFIGDLVVFRQYEPQPIAILPNDPYDSEFAAFKLSQFPKEFVVKRWKCGSPQRQLVN